MAKRQLQTGAIAALLLLPFTYGAHAQGLITRDKVNSYVAVLEGSSKFTPATGRPGSSGADYALDLTMVGRGAVVTNAAFLNDTTTNDVLVFSLWIKKYENNDSSAFWAVSPGSSGTQRGFQAHTPWSNGSVYFDTAGCCDGGTQRINEAITAFPGYTDATWWNDWHHWVFIKNALDKQIWIDGQLFLQGSSSAPLPIDITQLLIGRSGDNLYMHGQIDDFAVYGAALSDTDIGKLYTGTAPDALGAAAKLVAYWNFNDASPVVNTPVGSPIGFTVDLFDVGTSVLDTNTLTVSLNGSPVTPTSVRKTGVLTQVGYLLPNPPFTPGSTQYTAVTIKDTSGATFSGSGSFVVSQFGVLTADKALPASAVDKSKKGFKILTYQVDNTAAGNGVQVAEDILSGLYGPNVANLTDLGGVDAKGYFTWPGIINFDVLYGVNGRFNEPDYIPSQFPGIPGNVMTVLPEEHFASEFYTALEFPTAGLYTMVVNSDDCFATSSGPNPLDIFAAPRLGAFDATGGRGAADTEFQFFVQQPGVYGFRTVYQQGTGGGNIEWFMITNGVRVLINDITNAIAAYQWVPTISAAYVKSVTPSINAATADPEGVTALIVDGTSQVPANSVTLKINGNPVTALVTRTNNQTLVSYRPAVPFPALSANTATLAFTDGGTPVTREWNFTVASYSRDSVSNYVAAIQSGAAYTANGGGRSGQTGDYGLNLGTAGTGLGYVKRAGDFMNPAATNDKMTFSIWAKSHSIGQSSVFWANATTAGGGRGWQAHTPWDGSIYFDTAGCCGADTRISSAVNATTLPAYTEGFWTNWHNFIFTKDGPTKQVWIDGTLLVEGAEAMPLTTDYTDMYLGAIAPGNAQMRAILDEFSVYSVALTPADIAKLAAGSLPSTLADASKLIAYWNFNDAPAPGPERPTISVSITGAQLSITYTGTLQSSDNADGPYTAVSGATSPHSVDTTQAVRKFYRSAQQ